MTAPVPLFTLFFVVLLLADIGVRLWLATRQIRHVAANRQSVPPEFAPRIGLHSHQRAADYTVARVRLGMLERVYDAAILVALTLLGGLQFIDLWLGQLTQHDFLRQLLLLACVPLLLGLLGLPFTLWRQFRLEGRFGFNRMTPALFFSDAVKGVLVALVLGLPLAAAVLWLMAGAGAYWWLWAWGLWLGYNLLLLLIYPTFIAPLFNKFTPLNDPELAGRIRQLAQRCGFALNGLFVMDGSRRSAHGNAYFTGFGKSRRIVFFDTLLARLNGDEIEAVLAHELGHFARRHIIKRLALSFAGALVFFAALGWLARQPWFYEGLGVLPNLGGRNDAMALVLFFLVVPVFTFMLTPLASWYSRRDEFEADRYAAAQSSPDRLVSALVKLYDDNAATLTPDPVHSAFYDSHPPAAVRIRHLMAGA
ncbi:integral membrane zinc-metalloprotease [Bordetella pertussis]|uniref:Integral membrane zinc-metalloprotease n=5 Tax=Bordetella TaxID=517 RepID=Q7VVH6_BORPE|nr:MULTISPECIES: M48 family metallopeptidase [Bordetella]ETH40347.1 peptidase, M48 family [Bordetella pertussis H918]KCV21820.1 peptidase, M48 family [Bordetella pertussis B200]KCV26129.1 peptidase, M48 family [Bordetella pertussis H934]SHS94756.1 peptidase heat shock protein X HspX [Mycobacteroides abscessus subsp. abscessus]AEE67907.1 putative integral membrane zinc-metalloprotease [Bordetella pertussis CS]